MERMGGLWLFALVGLLALAASDLAGSDALAGQSPLDKKKDLIAKGRTIFFNETFKGNGRRCGTCHRTEDNFTITPEPARPAHRLVRGRRAGRRHAPRVRDRGSD